LFFGLSLTASRCKVILENTFTVEVKVKFALEQATKVQRRSRGISLLFL